MILIRVALFLFLGYSLGFYSTNNIENLVPLFKSNGMDISIVKGFINIETKNLPNHKTVYYLDTQWEQSLYEDFKENNGMRFRLNPNRIAEQAFEIKIPLHPKESKNKQATGMGVIGVSRNGVVLFNQYAAGRAPLTREIRSFDQSNGHPTRNGTYHYHIEPIAITKEFGKDAFIGLLLDGFPVYGPEENNKTITNDDLDTYHGHFGKTKEFPNGIYHYHFTYEAPYLNGNGYFGTPGTITN
ncbi:YHYH protein [Flavobacteriaceae bacterium]|nr:YHYH protein [Flavobacteriaceae bacterium]